MTAGAVVLLALTAYLEASGAEGWLRLAAAAAGVGTAAKYPGGLLMLPVLLARAQARPSEPVRVTARALLALGAVAAAAFLLLTPGILFEPRHALADVQGEMTHYIKNGHYTHTVARGLPHLARMLVYLGVVFFSHRPVIAGLFAVLSAVGAVVMLREDRRRAIVLLSFPVAYVLYFSSTIVMNVRNLLVVAPFFAVLVGRGAGETYARVRTRAGRYVVAAALASCLLENARWAFGAAESIAHRSVADDVARTAAGVQADAGRVYYLSRAAARLSGDGALASLKNVRTRIRSAHAARAIVALTDLNAAWPANDPGWDVHWLGPFEVNLNYYPTWQGPPRLVDVPFEAYAAALVSADRASPGAPPSPDAPAQTQD
jgi:hypothetical protein